VTVASALVNSGGEPEFHTRLDSKRPFQQDQNQIRYDRETESSLHLLTRDGRRTQIAQPKREWNFRQSNHGYQYH
jgi:hypothetical protein